MIRVQQLKLKPEEGIQKLQSMAAHKLRISLEEIKTFTIHKKSIDARKKPVIYFIYTIDLTLKGGKAKEEKLVKRCRDKQVQLVNPVNYSYLVTGEMPLTKPVVVGAGPAGLFCAYQLAKYGYQPVLLERGGDVDTRSVAVEQFWKTGELNLNTNVQFGEGGAGTFSDGKLNTLINDKQGRSKYVLETFVKFGAPEAILYDSKPHIGTDILKDVVKNMRNEIIALGGTVRFNAQMTALIPEKKEIVINGQESMTYSALVLALGHSARDTITMLYQTGLAMIPKAFAVGLRVEHPQKMINESQYGTGAWEQLEAAPYKVTAKSENGRGVYSFCMCPGGYVVNASSEPGRLAVNGMSYSGRKGKNANSAMIVNVTPEDFPDASPLGGIEFQRALEERAYAAGNGRIPVQLYEDFKNNVTSTHFGDYTPAIKGEYAFGNLRTVLPETVSQAFIEGMEQCGKQIQGFNRPDTILDGVESRTSSPVRIMRNENYVSNFDCIYPCGEGAGYAGGIMSAAMDGIKVFEAIGKTYKPAHLDNSEDL
jgi:hypothetical protein